MLLNFKDIISLIQAHIYPLNAQLPNSIPSEKIITDSRKDLNNSVFVAIKGDRFDGHDFIYEAKQKGAIAVIAQAVSAKKLVLENCPILLLVEDTVRAYQRIANLNRNKSSAVIIGLTGSCGKTSVKDILSRILADFCGHESVISTEGNTNNHIGVPYNLLKINTEHKYAVIEMGTNHPGEIEELTLCAQPDCAIITSIGRAHIEFLKSVEGVANEKSSIFRGLKQEGIAIIPANCDFRNILLAEAEKYAKKVLSFSTDENLAGDIIIKPLKLYPDGSEVMVYFKNGFAQKAFLNIPGKHQISNAAAASLAAYALGVPPEKICQSLQNLSISGMRMKKTELNSIVFINDAYNSNPESAKAGILHIAETYPQKNLYVFLGDMLELGEISSQAHIEVLQFALEKLPDAQIVVIGPQMKFAKEKLNAKKIISFENSDEAANFAKLTLKKGDIAYLKGSRGMKLENIEKAFQKENSSDDH